MWQLVCVALSCDLAVAAAYSSFRRSADSAGRRQYQVQHGSCSYTFLLPEADGCRPPASAYAPSAVQRDAPLDYDDSVQRLQALESIMENNTQWLLKLESYIQDNMKKEMVEIQQNAVQNQTAVMLEIGTNLLNQTAEQTRKLTDVEAQVLNQTTRLELQLLEHSLSTNKLEKQILDQTSEINKLQDKNSFLEKKVLDMEDKHIVQLQSIKEEKDQLQVLVSKQSSIIEELEKQLATATVNSSALQKQQRDLMETVHSLLTTLSASGPKHSLAAKGEQIVFRDCAEAFKSGLATSGVYTLTFPNSTQETKAYCDMDTAGGGWTVIQRRGDGSVDFQKTWKEYKVGFGNPSGEYWLGNEFVSQVTSRKRYMLRIRLTDWAGNEAHSLYEHFSLSGEDLNYRIHLKGLTGTAGKISSISQPGNDFSTKDADNDKCICKCSQMLTGGWWFDACGPSNLNGMYYPQKQSTNKFNGIKWYYWKGSGYSLKATAMMIRPADF
ncbi:angiopoietin-2 isoform X2 [Rousettus aegyptiacus]|uniref:Angiopoietin-2 n=1 Tax=Rousettus aegyptiacus TaxID=9407 RepID=A0A7J8DVK8_ROUAE|nr:angiopoietin-2 isoform X2 [Rousettus aegyptiacus]KAF6427121.1 angiopoietin 2 [Rousettus aegyptiacus]